MFEINTSVLLPVTDAKSTVAYDCDVSPNSLKLLIFKKFKSVELMRTDFDMIHLPSDARRITSEVLNVSASELYNARNKN